jgi:Fibronectin type III domain
MCGMRSQSNAFVDYSLLQDNLAKPEQPIQKQLESTSFGNTCSIWKNIKNAACMAVGGFTLLQSSSVDLHAAQSVTLAWNPNSETNLAGYRMYYGTSPRSYANVTNLSNLQTTCTIHQIQEKTTYYFAVTAFTDDGLESDYSEEVAYTVPYTTPFAPSDLSVTSNTNGIANLNWKVGNDPLFPSAVTRVYYGTVQGQFTRYFEVPSGTTNITITGLSTGSGSRPAKYYYTTTRKNPSGIEESQRSLIVNIQFPLASSTSLQENSEPQMLLAASTSQTANYVATTVGSPSNISVNISTSPQTFINPWIKAFEVSVNGVAGQIVEIQRSPDLGSNASWSTIHSSTVPDTGVLKYTDYVNTYEIGNKQRFYRALVDSR